MSEIDKFPDWKSLSGVILDGGYELKDIVEAERGHATIRVRVLGDYSLRASASFYLLDLKAARRQAELWDGVRSFQRKANLSTPLGSGTRVLDGLSTAYLVTANPDESLADVLLKRALAPEEATEVLRSVARALEELHANGLVHGRLSPWEVLAVQDSIKLSIESIREVNSDPIVESQTTKYLAPESDRVNSTIASDTWCLGATLFETLTQKGYQPGLYEEASALKHPFGMVAERCLDPDPDKRCDLGELEAILRSKAPPPKPKPVPVSAAVSETKIAKAAPVPAEVMGGSEDHPKTVVAASQPEPLVSEKPAVIEAVTQNTPVSSPVSPADSTAQTSRPERAALIRQPAVTKPADDVNASPNWNSRPIERPQPETGIEKSRGIWYALAAFVVIFAGLWFFRGHSSRKDAANQAAQNKASRPIAAAPAQPQPAWPTKTLSPDSKESKAALAPPSHRDTASAVPQPGDKTIWRVVLYTYNRQSDAENRVRELTSKRPDLHVQIFTTSDSGGPYMVVAGGKMDHNEAASTRQKALREGMPRDSYIQNYSK